MRDSSNDGWATAVQWTMGAAAMCGGALIYATLRPAHGSWLSAGLQSHASRVSESSVAIDATQDVGSASAAWLGVLIGSLPSFLHVLGLSLLFAALLRADRSTSGRICVSWLCVNALFEIAQHPSLRQPLAAWVESWLPHAALGQRLAAYCRTGTFDWFDLLAAALGAAVGFALCRASGVGNDLRRITWSLRAR